MDAFSPSRLRPAVYAALMALFLVAGCSSSKTVTAPGLPAAFPNHSASEIRTNIAAPTDTLDRFAGKARITVKSPQRNGSFNAVVRHRRADSLFMSFSLFGIEGARMLATPDSFYFYDKRNGQLLVGTAEKAEQVLPVPLSSGQVFENMLGLVRPESTINWTVKSDSTLYFLTDPSGRIQVTVDPKRWRVIRYAQESADGSLVEERLFHSFETVDGVQVPQRILFRRPGDDMMAELRYRDLDLTPGTLSFDLGVNGRVPRVGLPSKMSR